MRLIAPPTAPSDTPPDSPLVLRDGSVAVVRPATPGDQELVRQFFHHLSAESRYQRFLTSSEPSDTLIARLCQNADVTDAVTLLALRSADGQDRLIGMASYLRTRADTAEVAFAVDDSLGHHGIATGLLERLAALAIRAGFSRFQAMTLADNGAMLQVFRDSGFTIRSKLAGTVVEVELSLTPSATSVKAAEHREHTAAAASIRPLLSPAAVAVVGVSRGEGSLGRRVFDAVLAAGFAGPVYPVNPHVDTVAGHRCYHSMREVPPDVDLAVIAVPRDHVLATVDDCAAARVKSILVITAGFAETGAEGRALQDTLVRKARGYGMRMVGPNCMGLLNTHLRLNATFSPKFPTAGRVAFSSQSGALGLAIVALANQRGVGLSTFVSVGNKADVSGNDLLQFWEDDPATSVILLYLESFGNPRRFGRLARRIGGKKPIVVLKSGRTRAGRRAAGSHTAALAASDVAVDALFRQSGVIRADTIDEMFDVAACLDLQPLPPGRRIAIVTNTGGPGILAVDACEAAGLVVSEFSDATRARLAAFLVSSAALSNPVDMVASAGPDEYRRTIEATLLAPEVDALVIIYVEVDRSSPAILDAIRDGIAAARSAGGAGKPIVACVMADRPHALPLEVGGERVPTYPLPEHAIRALGRVAQYAAWRTEPAGLVWSFDDIRADEARALCRDIVARRGESWLTPEELGRLVCAFGLPYVPSVLARSAEDAAAVASVMGFPVAAKLSASTLVHKTDMGGVRLNLATPEAVRGAFDDLKARGLAHGLGDAIDGVLVQPMVAGGTEIIVGLVEDPLFGPLVGVGLGGVDVEVLGDVRFRMAPLTDRDADEMLHQMRGFAILDGHRGRPKADLRALADVLLRVSRLAEEIPEIQELDLNPVIVLAGEGGCRIVDARVKVGPGAAKLSRA